MSIFCRLCADTKDPSEIVTSINDPERFVERKLIACCQWNPQHTDFELPQDVCEFCYDKLENCWLFLQSVHSAQRKIQNLFENGLDSMPASRNKTAKAKFECFTCDSSFSTRIALEKHNCESIAQDLKCNICQRKFKTEDGFKNHCKKQGKHKCDLCLELFCTNKALESHKEERCENLIESVELIETKPNFVDCNSEVEENFEEKVGIDCEEPEMEKAPESESIRPIAFDTTATKPSFVDCDSEVDEKEEKPGVISEEQEPVRPIVYDIAPIQIHISMDTDGNSECRIRNSFPKDDTNREYYCYLCSRRFKKFPLLRYHMAVHSLPRRYKCQYCNSRFRTERHYTSHQRNHVDYYCDVCHKKFASAFALKVHKRMHTGASVKMYGCEECDHFFVDVSTFYNHMRRRHGLDTAAAKKKAKLIQPNGSAKPYVCEQCGKDFKERSSLKAHAVVHLDVRPFQCDVCFKAFKNKYNLKTHQETHSGEKSVQCTECGKKYSRKSVLIKHMEEHTGVFTRTFPCDFCDRVFRSLYNMQNHRRTHTGEKPYRCEVCNHSVTTKSQLDRHLKTISHINKLNESLGVGEQQDYV